MADGLEDRVKVLEVEGEKRVTRHILEQTRLNGEDLATLKSCVGAIATDLATLKSKHDRLEHKFDSFVKDFPTTVAQTMREVLNEREK